MLKIALGLHRTRLGADQRAIRLDDIQVRLVQSLLDVGAKPDDLLVAFEYNLGLSSKAHVPLGKFSRHWLLAETTLDKDFRIWSIVKPLVENGARVPKSCKILVVMGRRSMPSSEIGFTIDAGL